MNNKTLSYTTNKANKTIFKIVISSIILGILTFITSFVSSNLYSNRSLLQSASENLVYGSDYLTNQIKFYALTGNEKYFLEYEKEVNVTKTTTNALNKIIEIGVTKEEKTLMEKSKSLSDNLIKTEYKAADYVKSGDLKSAQNLLLGNEYTNVKNEINKYVDSFQNSIMKRANTNVFIFRIILSIFILFMIILSFITLNIFSKYSSFIKLNVIEPIISLKNSFEEISKGNLHTEFNFEKNETEIGEFAKLVESTQSMLVHYIDNISESLNKICNREINFTINEEYIGEFEKLKSSINKIIISFNEIISEINLASNQVAIGSEEIASTATSLSQGSSDQAVSIEDLSKNLSEISSSANENSNKSRDAECIVNSTVNKIKNSNNKMKEMLEAMNKITNSSNEIAKVLETINNMAFQTNLLAVNTAIEASRAGSGGKQFSVIAEEVRELANNCLEAYKKTSKLIEDSILAVENGNLITKDTANVLNEVNNDSLNILKLVKEISYICENQDKYVSQITSKVSSISEIVQSNSATSEESAAASEELASQAQVLNETVATFKLNI